MALTVHDAARNIHPAIKGLEALSPLAEPRAHHNKPRRVVKLTAAEMSEWALANPEAFEALCAVHDEVKRTGRPVRRAITVSRKATNRLRRIVRRRVSRSVVKPTSRMRVPTRHPNRRAVHDRAGPPRGRKGRPPISFDPPRGLPARWRWISEVAR